MALDTKILEKYKADLIRKGNDPKTAALYSKWLRDISDYFDIEDPLTLDFDEIKEFIEYTIKKRPANKKIVKSKTGEELDGAKLMQKAFSVQNPVIELDDLTTESGKNIQSGFNQIFSGAMIGIRNPKAHDNLETDIDEAVRLLCFCGELMDKIDNGKK